MALETLAASVHETIEKRTSLHETHEAAGARLGWSSGWKRPFEYGDWREEYAAVREHVGLMDVGTLGTFLIAGFVAWACPQTWDWTRTLTAAKGVAIAGLFIIAAIALTTQSFNPFIYFIF